MKNGTARFEAGLLAIAWGSIVAGAAQAEIAAANVAGFRVEHSIVVEATASEAWSAIITPGRWWSSDHTWSGDARNMRLAPRVGGCWCEKWKGGSVRHMGVISVLPDERLVLEGALGPLQSMGASGAMTMSIAPEGAATRISFSYSVGGFFDSPVESIAPAVDGVIGEQLGRLKAHLENGR